MPKNAKGEYRYMLCCVFVVILQVYINSRIIAYVTDTIYVP